MRVLCLCSYPQISATTRFRVEQFVGPLRERGIEMSVSPFLDERQFARMYQGGGGVRKAAGLIPSFFRRTTEILASGRYDLLFVQREAMFFGPAVFEWLMQAVGRMPMMLDLDDATYVRYTSPKFGRLGSALKFFGKTDRLIEKASLVTCGNRFIKDYVESKGSRAVVVPTVVDTEIFRPVERTNGQCVLGWIGTHSTFPSVESIFPILSSLAKKHRFVAKIVGSGAERIKVPGVEILNLPWALEREVEDFQMLDIGLYPITVSSSASEEWLKGKSGFKAVQYMSVGVPFVMSPVGICAEMGVAGKTHFNAATGEDWYNSLDKLLSDSELRQTMGKAGRDFSLSQFTLSKQADLLAQAFENAVRRVKA